MTPKIHTHHPKTHLIHNIIPVQNPNIRTEQYHDSRLQPSPVSMERVMQKRPESHHPSQKLIFNKLSTILKISQHRKFLRINILEGFRKK